METKFTHFISIPLNLDDSLTEVFEQFQKESGIPKDCFISPKKLHLTLQMLTERQSERAAEAMEKFKHLLPSQLSLNGLSLMKGTIAKAKVLYVAVENESELDDFIDSIQRELEISNNTNRIMHCTLANVKYSKSCKYFNADRALKQSLSFTKSLQAVHLSILDKRVDPQGYYKHKYVCMNK